MRKDRGFEFLAHKEIDEDKDAREALSAHQIWYGPRAGNPFLCRPIIVEAIGACDRRGGRISAAIGLSVSEKRFAPKYSARHEKVIFAISYLTQLPPDKILTKQRNRQSLDARCAIAAILFNQFNYSTPHIGRILKRDHSTIIHSLRTISPQARELVHKAVAMLFEAA